MQEYGRLHLWQRTAVTMEKSRFVGRISVRIHLLPGGSHGWHGLLRAAVVEDTNKPGKQFRL